MAGRSLPAGADPSDGARDPAGAWAGLAVLAGALLLAMTTWFSATAVVPQLEALWNLSPSAVAWLTIAVQVGFVAGALLSAVFNLADLLPPRRLMLLGSLGAAAANALLLLEPGVAAVVVLRLLTGAFIAAVYPPALKAMATWFRHKRGTALGIMVAALTLGSATPHLINGLGGLEWRTVIVGTSLLTLGGGLVAELLGRDGPYPFPKATFDLRNAWRVGSDRGVQLASVGYFGHMWELYAMWAWIAVFMADTFALHGIANPNRSAALTAFAVIGIGAVGCWIGGVLGDRWGRSRSSSLAMVISGSCALLIGPVRGWSLVAVVAIALLWGLSVIADSAQFSTVVTEVADQSYVGTALTMQLAIGFSLTVATIWLIPVLVESVTWRWAFAVLAAGPAVGTAAMLALLRSPAAARIANGRG